MQSDAASQQVEAGAAQNVQPLEVVLNWPESHWYESPLAAAFVGVLLGFLVSQLGTELLRRRERRIREESLMVAFRGEIKAIRASLRGLMRRWKSDLSLDLPPVKYKVVIPRTVFSANVHALGELRSAILVEQIVELYKGYDRIDDAKRRSNVDDLAYARLVSEQFYKTVSVDMKLRQLTKHIGRENYKIQVSQEDVDDQEIANFIVEVSKAHTREV